MSFKKSLGTCFDMNQKVFADARYCEAHSHLKKVAIIKHIPPTKLHNIHGKNNIVVVLLSCFTLLFFVYQKLNLKSLIKYRSQQNNVGSFRFPF